MNTKPVLLFSLIPCAFLFGVGMYTLFALHNGPAAPETAWFWTLIGLPAGATGILLVARFWKE